jgi:hypothetical protein
MTEKRKYGVQRPGKPLLGYGWLGVACDPRISRALARARALRHVAESIASGNRHCIQPAMKVRVTANNHQNYTFANAWNSECTGLTT